jgi:glycine C-acetyltransferase/8-amino-7-oxononanoate synthase
MRLTEQWIAGELATLSDAGLERVPVAYEGTGDTVSSGGASLLNFSSNDYLGLSRHPRVQAAAVEAINRYGAGATASRLVTGTLTCHEELESRLAILKGYPAALVFGSGYAANVGMISALMGRGDHIILDRLAHASLVDASVLSRARVHRFHHNDPDHARSLCRACPAGAKRLIVTESVFSMDGDLAPVPDLAAVAGAEGAMMLVDEAHATGIFGPGGAGLVRQAGAESRVNLSMGTLSKALGGLGGFVACSGEMRSWFIHKARSFIYSTALPPAMAGAALGALDVLHESPGMGGELLAKAARFRQQLRAGGLDTGNSQSQIIPVMVGDNGRAVRLHRRLRDQGILAIAIRPPTVPRGTARLRLSVRLDHPDTMLEEVAGRIVAAARAEGVIP